MIRGWFTRPLREKPIPPQPRAELDWLPGDRAECIAATGLWSSIQSDVLGPGPAKQQILRVHEIRPSHGTIWLTFIEYRGYAFAAGHFRKLRPCSADFREQLRCPVKETERRPLAVPEASPELVP